eukprot:m.54296 g.54296  ORF g.54296 m.54296 type:complete len:57 (-) comp11083_c0_seq1:1391-1561(-)
MFFTFFFAKYNNTTVECNQLENYTMKSPTTYLKAIHHRDFSVEYCIENSFTLERSR